METLLLQASSSLSINFFYLLASLVLCALALLGAAHLARPRSARGGGPPPPHDEAALKAYLNRNGLC